MVALGPANQQPPLTEGTSAPQTEFSVTPDTETSWFATVRPASQPDQAQAQEGLGTEIRNLAVVIETRQDESSESELLDRWNSFTRLASVTFSLLTLLLDLGVTHGSHSLG